MSHHGPAPALLAGVALLTAGLVFTWVQLTTPSDGARLEPGRLVWHDHDVVVTDLRSDAPGLQTGDRVTASKGATSRPG